MGVVIIAVVLTIGGAFFPEVIGVINPPLLFAGIAALYAIGIYAFWADSRTLLSINMVKVTSRGFYPPFKPKQHLLKEDWFVPYADVVEMRPVTEAGHLAPAYDLTLRGGLAFQVNALDLLVYVGEKDVRLYERVLRVIHKETVKQGNVEGNQKGKDVFIPKESFAVLR